VKDDTEEGTVDFQATVVFDEAEGPELIHKMTDPRPGCAHHLRQIFLTDFRDDLLWFTFLTEMRQQEQNAGQASLTGVEKLIHQVLFVPDIPRKQEPHEKLRELRLLLKQAYKRFLCDAQKETIGDCGSTGHATRLTRQTSLPEKAPSIKKRDDCLFALFGNNGELYFPLQDVENRVGRVALREDSGPLLVFPMLAFRGHEIKQFMRS